ncbi:Hypothetical protein A7982_00449 [Minicystis rosea]|nr:Hypothetical protein A7982_00449 [Minicystis rosea]
MVLGVFVALGCSPSSAPAPNASTTQIEGTAPAATAAPLVKDEDAMRRARAIIDTLASVKAQGLGYSAAYTGSEFLPYPKSGHAGMMLLQQAPPEPSSALGELVALGAGAVPALVACLAEARPTEIEPVRALQWMSYDDEYDFNRRTEAAPPGTVNLTNASPAAPTPYRVLVGDLCFVALGQILNRHFNAVRYQPSGGLVVSSPVRSTALRSVVVERLARFDREAHRAALMRDFREPDFEDRREGAALRLSYYYPAALEEVVPELLPRPTYDVFAVSRFAREELYAARDAAERRALFDRFLREHGPAGKTGLERQLFEDLSMLEANEQGRLSPKLTAYGTQPRELLIALYGFPSSVRASDKPYPQHLEHLELARLIRTLRYDRSTRIDDAVLQVMTTTRNGELALACMPRLAAHGHEADVKRAAQRLLDAGAKEADQLRKALASGGHGL